jgi:hypothetical protein
MTFRLEISISVAACNTVATSSVSTALNIL